MGRCSASILPRTPEDDAGGIGFSASHLRYSGLRPRIAAPRRRARRRATTYSRACSPNTARMQRRKYRRKRVRSSSSSSRKTPAQSRGNAIKATTLKRRRGQAAADLDCGEGTGSGALGGLPSVSCGYRGRTSTLPLCKTTVSVVRQGEHSQKCSIRCGHTHDCVPGSYTGTLKIRP